MKVIRSLLDRLYEVPALQRYKPIIGAADAILYGTDETTHAAPHVVDNIDIKRYMSFVILALLPAVLASVYFYGFRVIAIIMVSYMAGGAVEVIFAIVRKHDIHEGFLITGLIFPLVLPPTCPLWVVAVGVVFGTMFGKEMFGGTGRNIFNPALVGRLFITIAFPAIMTMNWQEPFQDPIAKPDTATTVNTPASDEVDAKTVATPLGVYKKVAGASIVDPNVVDSEVDQVLFMSASAVRKCAENPKSSFEGVKVNCYNAAAFDEAEKYKILQSPSPTLSEAEKDKIWEALTSKEAEKYKILRSPASSEAEKYEVLRGLTFNEAEKYEILQSPPLVSYGRLFVGTEPGSMGETCRIVIILGGIFLMFAKVSNWRIPVSYIGTVFVLASVGHHYLPGDIAPPVFQVFAGGLMFGAMFMATDPITSPFTKAGKYCFGISCGVLTVLIRSFSGYVEGVMFSIVIMNAFTPLIDQIVLMFKYRPAKT